MKLNETMSRQKLRLYEEVLMRASGAPIAETLDTVLNEKLTTASASPETQTSDSLALRTELLHELEGYGPIKGLLENPQVTEIIINAWNLIFFEQKGELFKLDSPFLAPISLERFTQRILMEMERIGDRRHPIIDGSLQSGARVNIVLPPISINPQITIRKHSALQWTLNDILAAGGIAPDLHESLQKWIHDKQNILICGATGSGKTTFLRALLREIPPTERIVTLEDTPELQMHSENAIHLLTRHDPEGLVPEVSLSHLVKNALRMRPDRIIVGEVRGEEALLLLDALSTGHRGSLCSIHAHSPQGALQRLESLVLRAAPQWGHRAVRQMIRDSIDLVLCVSRKKNGRRVLHHVGRISGLEEFGFLIDPVFELKNS